MANLPITFTLNSISTTSISVTPTSYGTDSDAIQGNRPDTNLVKYTLGDGTTVRIFTTSANLFTLNVAREILFASPTNGSWDVEPVVAGGDSYSIQIATTSGHVPPSAAATGNVPGGGGAPCFVAASQLLTSTGYKSAADIKTGDLLMTADGRKVPVKAFSFTVENANQDTAPFLLPANSLSPSCPKADLRLSPWHAIQMKKGLWMKPMSAFELGAPIQQYDLGKDVTYYHFEAPNFFKDNFICNGTVVESFSGHQVAGMKPNTVYKYNPKMKAYTRLIAKPASKAIMM